MTTLNWLDYTILAVILLSTITGLFRGFVKELIAICVWALAIWLGYQYAGELDSFLQGWVSDARLRYGIGFILIMLATLIVGGIVSSIIALIMKKSGLSATDRMLGMGFGILRGVVIVSLILVVMHMTSLSKQEGMKNSQLAAQFDPVVITFQSYMPTLIQQIKALDTNQQLASFEEVNALPENSDD